LHNALENNVLSIALITFGLGIYSGMFGYRKNILKNDNKKKNIGDLTYCNKKIKRQFCEKSRNFNINLHE